MRSRNDLPVPVACPGCGAPILLCLYNARPVGLDPQAINLAGEVQALAHGQRTFELSGFGVIRRCAQAITFIPEPVITDIHREHKCGAAPVSDGEKRKPRAAIYWGDEPPF